MSIVICGKKTFTGQVVVAGVTIDWIATWQSEYQEYVCNVKLPSSVKYNATTAVKSADRRDAVDSLWSMAHDLAVASLG